MQATRGHCVVPMPVDSKTIFRPPVDCSVCRDVHQVDVVVNITPAEFEEKYEPTDSLFITFKQEQQMSQRYVAVISYAYSGRPVVVKNALVNWTATELFSYEFFKELYGSTGGGRRPAKHRCQFFPYRTEFRSLSHALAMTPERIARPFYFGWSNCDSETADVLRQHYARPYFLPERSESSRTDWIFMGTAGLGAHMHVMTASKTFVSCQRLHLLCAQVDHVGLPSWQAQIRGRKLWSLEPPPECYYQCQSMDITVEPGDTSNDES